MRSRQWYVVVTRAAAEWQAQREILNKGLHCYYPYYYADVRRGRWAQGAIKPQFPGYIFVGVDQGESIEPVRSVAGVNHLIKHSNGPLVMSDAQMMRCKQACHQRQLASIPRIWKEERLAPGDWITIPHWVAEGAGLPAEVLSIDKNGRIVASLGNLRISCHRDDLSRGVRASAKPSQIPRYEGGALPG